MSTPSPPASSTADRHGSPTGHLRQHAPTRTLVQGAFWAAIGLPVLHLPLLLAGVNTPGGLGAFLGLLTLNVVCLAIGHGHRG